VKTLDIADFAPLMEPDFGCCRKHLFKEDFQSLVNELRIPTYVTHYPIYCSTFNPIENYLFCHIIAADQGILFDSQDE
jgi:hypothetical protein